MPNHVYSLRYPVGRLFLGLTAAFALVQHVGAQPVTDGNVPMLMDAGGTEANPAVYIIGENGRYDRNFGSEWLTVGEVSPWNSLSIQNGSVVASTGGMTIGVDQRSSRNRVTVDAAVLNATYLDVGFGGDYNRLEVRGGGSVSGQSSYVGYSSSSANPSQVNGGNQNELTVSGANSLLTMDVSMNVGFYGSGNTLTLEDGGTVRIGGFLTVGTDGVSSDNNVVVRGSSSLLEVGSSESSGAQLNVGFGGSRNVLRVEAGGTANVYGDIHIGRSGSTDGGLIVSGANSSVQAENINIGTAPDAGYPGSAQGNGNVLRVEDGGKVTLSESLQIGRPSGQDNTIVVSGRDSVLYVEGEIAFGSGLSGGNAGGTNFLTVEDGALVNVGFLSVDPSAGEGENIIRLNGGYIAWQGNNMDGLAELLDGGLIQVWNTGTGLWENALGSQYFSYGYFDSDEAALAFSGYEGLGGTTIFTGMIPEPSTYAALIAVVAVGFVAVRRRRMSEAN